MSEDSGATGLRRFAQPVLLGGLIAGTVDIGAACLINGRGPTIILQAIASGVLGKASFHSGAPGGGARPGSAMGDVGADCRHICRGDITFAGRSKELDRERRRVRCGGILRHEFVVVPLSAAGFSSKFSASKFIENMLAMILFGLIIAFFGRVSAARASGEVKR